MNRKHGQAGDGKRSPTYQSWHAMMKRCRDPNYKRAAHYILRGIEVCCTRMVEYNGETLCVRDWENKLGFGHGTILRRLNQGETPPHAMRVPRPWGRLEPKP